MPYTHGAYRTLVVRTLQRLSCISRHRSPVGINRCHAAPTPTGFAEIVSDDSSTVSFAPEIAPTFAAVFLREKHRIDVQLLWLRKNDGHKSESQRFQHSNAAPPRNLSREQRGARFVAACRGLKVKAESTINLTNKPATRSS